MTTDSVWDVNSALPVVLDDGANRYVYGLDLIAAIDGSDEPMYYTYDGLGSTTDLTDNTGTVTDTYSYDVFGAVRASTGSSENDWLFTGEQHDADSGLYYLRARHHDPATGRFLSQDPMSGSLNRPATQNPYPYVLNSPLNMVDPTGQSPIGDIVSFLFSLRPRNTCSSAYDYACGLDLIHAIFEWNRLVEQILNLLDDVNWRNVVTGGTLVVAGGVLLVGGVILCSSIVSAELAEGGPIGLLLAPHTAGVCYLAPAFGGAVLLCGVVTVATGNCIPKPTPAKLPPTSRPKE